MRSNAGEGVQRGRSEISCRGRGTGGFKGVRSYAGEGGQGGKE